MRTIDPTAFPFRHSVSKMGLAFTKIFARMFGKVGIQHSYLINLLCYIFYAGVVTEPLPSVLNPQASLLTLVLLLSLRRCVCVV